MDRHLRFSLFGLLAIICMGMSAQTTVKFDFTGGSAYGMKLLSGTTNEYNPDPYTFSDGGVNVTLNGSTRWWKATKGNELRFYKESGMEIAAPAGKVITSITLTATKATDFNASTGTYENGVWKGNSDKVTINCTITKSNSPVSSFEVTYVESGAPVKKDPGLAFSEKIVKGTVGQAFTAPTLTKETDGAVTYASGDETVATVDAQSGTVTLMAEGTVVITATAAETADYSSGSASYTINVSAPVLDVVNEPYSETFAGGQGSFLIDNVSLGEGLSHVWKHDASYKYMKASAFANGKNIASESWLVSPWIVLSVAEVIRTLTFEHCINKYFGYPDEEATVWVKEEGGQWRQMEITYPAIKDGDNWSSFEKQSVSLAGYEGKKIKVGFKYVSTADAAGTWEIRNFSVDSGVAEGIAGIGSDTAEQVVYNLAGQRLDKPVKGLNIINGKKVIVR